MKINPQRSTSTKVHTGAPGVKPSVTKQIATRLLGNRLMEWYQNPDKRLYMSISEGLTLWAKGKFGLMDFLTELFSGSFQTSIDQTIKENFTNDGITEGAMIKLGKKKDTTYSSVIAKFETINLLQKSNNPKRSDKFAKLSAEEKNTFKDIEKALIKGTKEIEYGRTEEEKKIIDAKIYREIGDISLEELEKMEKDLTKIQAKLKANDEKSIQSQPTPLTFDTLKYKANMLAANIGNIKKHYSPNITKEQKQELDNQLDGHLKALSLVKEELPMIRDDAYILPEDKLIMLQQTFKQLETIEKALQTFQRTMSEG